MLVRILSKIRRTFLEFTRSVQFLLFEVTFDLSNSLFLFCLRVFVLNVACLLWRHNTHLPLRRISPHLVIVITWLRPHALFSSQCEVLGVNPLYLMLPATVITSYAFMLPVSTPPNAIAYSYGHLTMSDMVSLSDVWRIVHCDVMKLSHRPQL